jgi:hypothetical protein
VYCHFVISHIHPDPFVFLTITTVVLTDFGLSSLVFVDRLVYKEERKRRDDGTLCYNSVDVHRGALCSYRSDVEILVYSVCEWLAGTLPWKVQMATTDSVLVRSVFCRESMICQAHKLNLLAAGVDGMRRLLAPARVSDNVVKKIHALLAYARSLEYTQQADYNHLKQVLLVR